MKDRIYEAPQHLRENIEKLFSVQRFRNYEKGIFYDNSGAHTIRGIDLIDILPLSNDSKEAVKARFWPHDVPEIMTLDYTVIEKQDKGLALSLSEQEKSAARILLTEQDQKYLSEFNLAAKVLKGEEDNNVPTPEATIAVIVDRVEGNIFFHISLARWTSSQEYDPDKLPPSQALTYTFVIDELFRQNIPSCNLQGEFQQAAEYLLKYQLDEVKNAWGNVPIERFPSILLDYLKKYSLVENKQN